MSQKSLSHGLKALVVVAVATCVVVLLAIASITERNGLPAGAPAFFAVGVAPLMLVALHAWRLFSALGRGEAFTHANAARLGTMGRSASASSLVWLAETIAYLALVQPLAFSVVASLSVALIFCVALAVVCAGLSLLTERAAALKDENDLVV